MLVARGGAIVPEPASARVAGMIARIDNDRGFWWSPSNQEMFGIVGTSRPVDFALGESRKIEQGEPPYEDIRRLHDSEADARASIVAHANSAARSNAELSIDLPGRSDIQTEAPLVLSGWRPLIPDRWRITRVTHDLKPAGYTCRISAEVLPKLLNPIAVQTVE